MAQSYTSAAAWRRALAAALLVGPLLAPPAAANDGSREREHLAAVVRQIDLIDRLARQSAAASPRTRSRYHFDYRRFNADLQRLRHGVNDYLAPPRAQPRDPSALTGDYSREARPETGQ
ncbi:RAQPRD family integrative conjugative element protein [Shinella sumterensis]|uniref:RAQPRD family integrative conjugative element protein n=1 Tax=Rhizobium subbaraonis TaxID=908946 RepID=A0A285US94_9HYPH|nr:RAQPRD family integrative conjugative element protein [Rhizobium subbaraonis]WLS10021.1 RAQPRD family integrative conjugative element protein [Shinella sumterensis]SOC44720.1 RAQPRD family integrative conjugative element protein [Rhizobium subbaraonis]